MNERTKLYSRSDSRTKEENRLLALESEKNVGDLLREGKLTERAIRCPVCGRIVLKAVSDLNSGHLNIRCKCGVTTCFDLGVFYTRNVDNSLEFKL